uniref:NADH-ubiquinone oxidoreductase chain 6 n=1 Tax=Gymnochthebius lividus TaxID=2107372 RepID=A0A7H0DK38_9COLE|nr:NADH dehydrogenase subunit 6 [Gymnochthebius lividus]QNP09698.1 NADH dehydrogenase subunit 6 [Gymnochthebius lividus]
MSLLLIMNILFSMLFLFMLHPLSMGTILLMQTILVSLITGFLNFNFWFSYILFLIMIGGMLVLFIYMTSLASNEKFKFNFYLMLIMMMMFFILVIFNFIFSDFFLLEMFNKPLMKNTNYILLSKYYNNPSWMIMIMMMIYLFITLIAVVKITNLSMGPLRQNI